MSIILIISCILFQATLIFYWDTLNVIAYVLITIFVVCDHLMIHHGAFLLLSSIILANSFCILRHNFDVFLCVSGFPHTSNKQFSDTSCVNSILTQSTKQWHQIPQVHGLVLDCPPHTHLRSKSQTQVVTYILIK